VRAISVRGEGWPSGWLVGQGQGAGGGGGYNYGAQFDDGVWAEVGGDYWGYWVGAARCVASWPARHKMPERRGCGTDRQYTHTHVFSFEFPLSCRCRCCRCCGRYRCSRCRPGRRVMSGENKVGAKST
jgi:hypothetical protein